MVHPGMVGITELMTDDGFVAFMEGLDDATCAAVSVHDLYSRYRDGLAAGGAALIN